MATRTRVQSIVGFAILAISLMLPLGGCAGGGPAPIPSQGIISVAPDVNPNPEGRASPIVLRVYALGGEQAFSKADFFSLYSNAAKVLGKDLLSEHEYELQPGESHDFSLKLPAGAHYVGVVAAFRDIDKATWKGIVTLPHGKQGLLAKVDILSSSVVHVHIRLERLAVSVSLGKS